MVRSRVAVALIVLLLIGGGAFFMFSAYLTGDSPLLTFNIRQDQDRNYIRAMGRISGTGRMLKQVCFVYLVDLVHLVSLAQPNKPNNGLLALADFFSVLLETR